MSGNVMDMTLRWFAYDHLSSVQYEVSKKFSDLANELNSVLPDGTEKSIMLRKLLEAKDAAVRASVDMEG